MNVLEQLAQVLADLLRADERRVLLGEDIADGTMLGLSRVAAADKELAKRLVSTPLLPTTLAAHAGGIAAAGMRPIVIVPSAGALLEGMAAVRETAAIEARSGDHRNAPVLFISTTGPGFGLGGDAAEAPEAMLAQIPGLRVLVVGNANEAAAIVQAAAEFWAGEQPTVVLVPRRIALQTVAPEPNPLQRPFASAHRVREGMAATVFAWGECVELATQAADSCGHDVRVVNVESLAPLSNESLVAEAKATGKIVVVHSGPKGQGVGAELAALFADEAILYLDAPILRVCGSTPPLGAGAEANAAPTIAAITDAITSVANY